MDIRLQIPKSVLTVLNQLFEVEQKLNKRGDPSSIKRNIDKMKDALAEEGLAMWDAGIGRLSVGLLYENPLGQDFNETRTDLEANISGTGADDLVVVDVVKPIIRAVFKNGKETSSRIVQRGIVVVESRKE